MEKRKRRRILITNSSKTLLLRKAQLTVFFVVGLILISVVFIASEIKPQEQQTLDLSVPTELKNYVESCLEQTAEQGIYDVLLQGGYYDPPSNSIPIYEITIPLYWKESVNLIPSIGEIEEQIELYIQDNIDFCINDFEPFEKLGYTIENAETIQDISEMKATVTETGLVVTMNSQVILVKGNKQSKISSFIAEVTNPIEELYSHVSHIMSEQHLIPDTVPLALLTTLAKEHNFTFEVLHYNENAVIIVLIKETPDKEDVVYAFMQEYEWFEEAS